MDTPAVEFRNVSKIFPGVKALEDVSFSIASGEVHALLGENGAGKSTLLNILHGVYSQYEGAVDINGQRVAFASPSMAIEAGVAKVHQEVSMVTELTVAQNVTMGYEPRKGLFLDFPRMNRETDALLARLGCHFKATDPVRTLNAGEMQMIAIAKALYHNASIISFDEPTTSLTNNEIEHLFQIIQDLQEKGITIVYVSHKLDEIFQIADRATVLRDGRYINTFLVSDITREQLIHSMVGRDVANYAVRLKPRCVQPEEVLRAEQLNSNAIHDVSFSLHKGEILGFSGLVGSKRTDIMRSIFGADPLHSGTLRVAGKAVRIKRPEQALLHSIGLLPENRKTEGFVKGMSNADNIGLASLKRFCRGPWLDHKAKRENCLKYMKEIDLNPKNPDYPTSNLSGGNQQKAVLSKWLSTGAEILIFDEPTKGVDVGAKAEIYRLMEELVAQGKSIIMVSSELPEIIGMSDRVIVMHEGRIAKELSREELTEAVILKYAMGE